RVLYHSPVESPPALEQQSGKAAFFVQSMEATEWQMAGRNVFIAGGTGYLGRCLIPRLVEGGHHVCALVRPQSQRRLLAGCTPVVGIALDRKSYESAIGPADTFVQLVGVSHPSPTKAAQFESIDLVAGREAVGAAVSAGVQPFVYVSVSHPA